MIYIHKAYEFQHNELWQALSQLEMLKIQYTVKAASYPAILVEAEQVDEEAAKFMAQHHKFQFKLG